MRTIPIDEPLTLPGMVGERVLHVSIERDTIRLLFLCPIHVSSSSPSRALVQQHHRCRHTADIPTISSHHHHSPQSPPTPPNAKTTARDARGAAAGQGHRPRHAPDHAPGAHGACLCVCTTMLPPFGGINECKALLLTYLRPVSYNTYQHQPLNHPQEIRRACLLFFSHQCPSNPPFSCLPACPSHQCPSITQSPQNTRSAAPAW